MPGRKPVPTALRLIRGNPGKRALPKNEPQPVTGADIPPWLSPLAKKHWRTLAPHLEACGILTQIDASALGLYCDAFVRWRDATEKVEKFGSVVKAPSGIPMVSPYMTIVQNSWEQMRKILIEFGMTPVSRSRVTAAKPKENESEYSEFADD